MVDGAVRRYRVPPGLGTVGIGLVYLAVDVAAPIGLAQVDHRQGWSGSWPGPLNVVALPILFTGTAIVLRSIGTHLRGLRRIDWRIVKVERRHLLTPDYLVTDGAYRWSRNPLYVGDLVLWLGWAVLFGSLPVAAGFVVLAAGLSFGVRLEERGLRRKWGAEWIAYAARTPRFVGPGWRHLLGAPTPDV